MKNEFRRNDLLKPLLTRESGTMLNRPKFASRANHLPVENAEEEMGKPHTAVSLEVFASRRHNLGRHDQILMLVRSLQNNVRRKTNNE